MVGRPLTKRIGEISPTCLVSIANHQKRGKAIHTDLGAMSYRYPRNSIKDASMMSATLLTLL